MREGAAGGALADSEAAMEPTGERSDEAGIEGIEPATIEVPQWSRPASGRMR